MPSVCAEVVVRNEALFLEESLLSIVGCFDEIVVVDHGSVDETISILDDLGRQIPEMRVFKTDGRRSLADCRNMVAENTKCEWVFKWDADFVGYERGDPRHVSRFLEELNAIDRKGYNLVLLHAPNCGPTPTTTIRGKDVAGRHGDIKVTRREIFHYETAEYADTFVVRDADNLRRVWLNREDCVAHFVHLDRLKLPARLVLRDLMLTHDRDKHSSKTDLSFEQWIMECVGEDLEIRTERLLETLSREIVPFDFERWGPHPKILQNAANKAPMELRNGLLTETIIKYEFPLLEHWLQDNGLTTPRRRSLEEAP